MNIMSLVNQWSEVKKYSIHLCSCHNVIEIPSVKLLTVKKKIYMAKKTKKDEIQNSVTLHEHINMRFSLLIVSLPHS